MTENMVYSISYNQAHQYILRCEDTGIEATFRGMTFCGSSFLHRLLVSDRNKTGSSTQCLTWFAVSVWSATLADGWGCPTSPLYTTPGFGNWWLLSTVCVALEGEIVKVEPSCTSESLLLWLLAAVRCALRSRCRSISCSKLSMPPALETDLPVCSNSPILTRQLNSCRLRWHLFNTLTARGRLTHPLPG